jgi:hypothetical protein
MGGIQDFLVQQLKNAVLNHTDQQGTGFDPSALLHQITTQANQGNLNPGTVTDLIRNHADDQAHTGFDPGPLLSQVQGLFGQHQAAQQADGGQYGDVKSSDEDPYGDPADGQGNFGNVKSSDEDPYGDPADEQGNFGNVKSSDEDPYGDPADEETPPRRR